MFLYVDYFTALSPTVSVRLTLKIYVNSKICPTRYPSDTKFDTVKILGGSITRSNNEMTAQQ